MLVRLEGVGAAPWPPPARDALLLLRLLLLLARDVLLWGALLLLGVLRGALLMRDALLRVALLKLRDGALLRAALFQGNQVLLRQARVDYMLMVTSSEICLSAASIIIPHPYTASVCIALQPWPTAPQSVLRPQWSNERITHLRGADLKEEPPMRPLLRAASAASGAIADVIMMPAG